MTQIANGKQSVVIKSNGAGRGFRANLYVDVRGVFQNADITNVSWSGKTMAGAVRWAKKQLALN
jgi:hypothetical protein